MFKPWMISLAGPWLFVDALTRHSVMVSMALLALGSVGSFMAPGLMASAAHAKPPNTAIPALYPTRSEAEEAAQRHFQCTGAHPMGKQWMPCAQHAHDHGSHP